MKYSDANIEFEVIEFENAKELITKILDWYDARYHDWSNVQDFIDHLAADIHLELDETAINIKTVYSKLFGDDYLPQMNFEYQEAHWEVLHRLTKYASTYAEALTKLGDYVDAYISIHEEISKRFNTEE